MRKNKLIKIVFFFLPKNHRFLIFSTERFRHKRIHNSIIKTVLKMKVRLGACKTGLSPPVIYITVRSMAILLLWF